MTIIKIINKNKIILLVLSLLMLILPWLEHEVKGMEYYLLLLGSGLIGLLTDWRKIKFDLIEILFLLFLISAAISTNLSSGISRSFMEMLRYLAYFLIFIQVRRFKGESKILKKIFIGSILVNSLLLSIVSWSFLFRIPLLPYPSSGMNLYYGVFGHNRLADLLLFAIPMTFFLVLEFYNNKAKSVQNNKIFITLLIFFVITFLSTFSKSGYMVMIILFFIITIFFADKLENFRMVKKISILLILPIFIFYLFIILNTYFFHYCGNRGYSWFCKPLYQDWRWEYFTIALNSLKEKPFFGVGLDNFRYLSFKYQSNPPRWSIYGENYYFTLLSEAGILGFLLFGGILFISLRRIIKKIRQASLQDTGIFFSLLASTLHVFVSDDWYFLSIFLYFWIGLGLLLLIDKET